MYVMENGRSDGMTGVCVCVMSDGVICVEVHQECV